MNNRHLILFLAAIIVFQSCSKDDKPSPNQPPAEKLARIEWSTGSQKDIYEYNPDNTLKKITYSSGQLSDVYAFTWQNGKVTEMYEENSLYKNIYHYNGGGKVSYMTNSLSSDPSKSYYKMEYTYRQDGKVDQLKYFIINEAGTELKAGTSYQYNASGELASTVTIMDNYTITQTIEGYSQPVQFNPWGFIDLTLLENYMIFNYPVLSTMKGFPAKVTRTVKIDNNPEFVDVITTNTCEISQNRINKMTIDFKVPALPSLNKTSTAIFYYKP